MKYFFLFFLLVLGITHSSKAVEKRVSNYYFSHITGENGLSQSCVQAILQDSYGFMWFGTRNGLNRYDGVSVRVFYCEDEIKQKNNHNILSLFNDGDNRLWVGTEDGIYLFDPVTEKFSYLDIVSETGIPISGEIRDIREDRMGNIWILSHQNGLFRYDGHQVYRYTLTDTSGRYTTAIPECITIGGNGNIWVGTQGAGLFDYRQDDDDFRQYLTDGKGNSLSGDYINYICEADGKLALAIYEGGLKIYNPVSDRIAPIHIPSSEHPVIKHICTYENLLWISTQSGIYIVDSENKIINHITENPVNPYGLSDKIVKIIYEDINKGLWIGTQYGGVNYMPQRSATFEKYIPLYNGRSLSSKKIGDIVEDPSGKIWIGTEDGGINVLDPKTGIITLFKPKETAQYNATHIRALTISGDKVWCSYRKGSIAAIHHKTGQVIEMDLKNSGLNSPDINSLYINSRGRIWVGTEEGAYISDGKVFNKVDQLNNSPVVNILEDRDGIMWFATRGKGLYKYDGRINTFINFLHVPGDSMSISSDFINDITEDIYGNIWLSTDRGGLCKYDKGSNTFLKYCMKEIFPDDAVYSVLEDSKNNLWFGTNRGLVKFNPSTRNVRVYTKKDGLLGNQFSNGSAWKSRDGKFYFGSIDGLIAFRPEAINNGSTAPSLYFTRLSIFNEEVSLQQKKSPLQKSILFTQKIELPYNQSSISFDFVALNFATPEAMQYRYKMGGIDKEWIRATDNRNISYSQLPPGSYRLWVQALDNDSDWKQVSAWIDIIIRPPWWKTNLAFFIYSLLFFGMLACTIHLYLRRKDRQQAEKQRLFEIEKEKELYSAKVEFFTEIAHEVRTPLTLINGPLEAIMKIDIKEPVVTRNLKVIAQNTKRLLELTRQLLDFRKVDAKKFIMNFDLIDVSALITETISSFEPTFINQQKEIIQYMPEATLSAIIDKEAVTKILSNLLSNALKYSEHTTVVELSKESTSFTVKIITDGKKIPAELSEHIFVPFYRIQQNVGQVTGTGIGLPLARSLAELHRGRLYLDTNTEKNIFILTLPLSQEITVRPEDYDVQHEYILQPTDIPGETADTNGYTILFVEDNIAMNNFITGQLREYFTVETAMNGREALDIIHEKKIDLIVSDLMMPEMNGMELCKAIKSDVEWSHIPFIFLTAKNDLESKINGLRAGAEAYVEKPFSFNYLRTQIITLLNNRQKEREAFAKRPFFPVHNMKMNRSDEEFMDKIIGIIQENISDENFNVERLAETMFMSRSNLLRKIKALTNLSAVDFIRLIRLKRAAELILEGKYRMGEICIMVGINSASYFSKQFQKQFGLTPKEFEQQNRITWQP